jgi:hypothetical protein
MIALAICFPKIQGSTGEAAHGNLQLISATQSQKNSSDNSKFSKDRNLGKRRETQHHDNGIVEVTGSIPVGSTN